MDFATTARGIAKLASPEDIEREDFEFILIVDSGLDLVTDSGDELYPNSKKFGYTNPNLHRRIDLEAVEGTDPLTSNYPFMHYDEDSDPYKQSIVLGVWDGLNSYRTTTTYIHDEESETCEIP